MWKSFPIPSMTRKPYIFLSLGSKVSNHWRRDGSVAGKKIFPSTYIVPPPFINVLLSANKFAYVGFSCTNELRARLKRQKENCSVRTCVAIPHTGGVSRREARNWHMRGGMWRRWKTPCNAQARRAPWVLATCRAYGGGRRGIDNGLARKTFLHSNIAYKESKHMLRKSTRMFVSF